MKILQVMPDFETAGAQTMLENLSMQLIKDKSNNIKVISFYNKRCAITERMEKNNIEIYYLGKIKGFDIRIIFKLYKIIKKFNPDVIHTHRYSLEYIMPAIKLLNNKSIKIIHTIHNVAEKEVPDRLQKMQKIWFENNQVIPVAISQVVQKSICNRYNVLPENVPIINNGIDLSKCIKKNDYKFNNRIVHIGRFTEQKNQKELIDIFSIVMNKKNNNKLQLILVGEGEQFLKIKEYVKYKNIEKNVIFKGKIDSCYNILNQSDIFVMPSKWEGMPMTIIEAMGTGIPIVAYPVGGIKDIINDGLNGFLVNNIEEFADRIMQLENNIKLRERIGNNAKESANQYSSKEMSKRYKELYLKQK